MPSLFWGVFLPLLLALLVVSVVELRVRLRRRLDEGRGPRVDDDAVRAILETGRLATNEDEPLDLHEIENEERRFWTEDWEDPEEW